MSPLQRRILVIDDDPLIQRSVERALLKAGYVVYTAGDIAEAIRWASEVTVDAALVDYALGREDGLTALARLRELQPSCLRVLMTGQADFPMVVEAINRGEVVRVLRKPFQTADLLGVLKDAFASARRLEEVTTARLIGRSMTERRILDETLNRNLLRLALQPIHREDEVVAYEALLRPQHPELPSPTDLLQAAERHGRVLDVGTAVLDLSVGWVDQLPPHIKLFVNLHPAQLGDAQRLERDLAPLTPRADQIVLEITERSRLQDMERWEESVAFVSQAGFSLAVDDLGAGYSSLIMLADLQPQYIKLDMSLVRNIHHEPRKQRLVQLMVTFAEATQALTIAEGVESAEEAAALNDCGIHLMQGYYYGRPQLTLAAAAG